MNPEDSKVEVVRTGGCHDCGGRCPYKLHVREGRVVRMEPDGELRACVRGYAMRQRIYSSDWLTRPLKRIGRRGEGKFAEITWDEALDTAAHELKRVKESWGNGAILHVALGGGVGGIHCFAATQRLFNQFGGAVRMWGGPSAEAYVFASRATYGTLETGNAREDLENARLVILWGSNPVETIFGTNTSYQLIKAREAGARFICVDPRLTDSGAVFADQWVPIRPGTDVAMMLAMAFVMIRDDLHDARFVERCAVGFDQFESYVMGVEDGVPKTPEWAAARTGVAAPVIEKLAREYAVTKPAALITGFAPGRTERGEQFHRAAAILATLTGNVGRSGTATGGFDRVAGMPMHQPAYLPWGKNPLEAGASRMEGSLDIGRRNRHRVHWAKLWDCILEGVSGGYPSDIKLAYVVGANPLNQVQNVNKGIEALRKLESIIVHEQFMTPTAKFADLVLPVNSHWARDDILRPWYVGSYYICANKAIESLPETKSDFDIAVELASRLGIQDFSDKDAEGWRRHIVETEPDMRDHVRDYGEFRKEGLHRVRTEQPTISLKQQVDDPEKNPFRTPSGKIEIYALRIAELDDPKVPAIPKYADPEEGPSSALARNYPLQLITYHSRTRAHSVFGNVSWLKDLEPQALWLSAEDARARGIADGKSVSVFNDRGRIIVPAKVTERILPGVVALGEGAWYTPDEDGVDKGGCPNVLTNDQYSPGGAFVSNSCLVQVEKA